MSRTLAYDFLLDSASTIAQAVLQGPIPDFTAAGNRMSFDSVGNLVFAPHQLLENANLSDPTGEAPSGWSVTNEGAGNSVVWTDGGRYFSGVFTCGSAGRVSILNSITVLASTTYTAFAFIENSAITAGDDLLLRASGTSGTDGDITDADWDALGGVAGWYAVGFTMGADVAVSLQIGCGISIGDTVGASTISRPGVVKGLLPGVGVNVPAKLSGEPLGRWVGTDDGDEPLYDQPRYAHDPADSDAQLGMLMEEARTNLCLQADDLETTWTNPGANTTITANAGTAATGNATADDVLHGDAAETLQQTITVTDNTVVTISGVVQQGATGAHDWVKMEWMDNSDGDNGFEFWADLSTGNVGTAQASGTGSYTASSVFMTDIGGGRYRIGATGQIVTGQTDGRLEIINTTADAVDTAEATNSVFWSSLQVEESASVTSIIPTTTASVTRAKDVNSTTDETWYNFLVGTFYAQFSHLVPTSSTDEGTVFDIRGQGAGSDRHRITIDYSVPNADFRRNTAGDDFTVSGGTITANTTHRVALASIQDDAAAYANGVSIGTNSTIDPADEASWKLGIGMESGEILHLNGYLQAIEYYDTRLPNGDLEKLTLGQSIGAVYMPAIRRRRR